MWVKNELLFSVERLINYIKRAHIECSVKLLLIFGTAIVVGVFPEWNRLCHHTLNLA